MLEDRDLCHKSVKRGEKGSINLKFRDRYYMNGPLCKSENRVLVFNPAQHCRHIQHTRFKELSSKALSGELGSKLKVALEYEYLPSKYAVNPEWRDGSRHREERHNRFEDLLQTLARAKGRVVSSTKWLKNHQERIGEVFLTSQYVYKICVQA